MSYYILNINLGGESKVDYWLESRGLAPIFYGHSTLSQIKSGIGHNLQPQAYADAKKFVDTFSIINDSAIVFSIGNEYVYIFKQDGSLQEIEENEEDLVKAFKIKLLKKVPIKSCPLVLVSIKANRYIASGTFRDLNNDLLYLGNTKALEYLISDQPVVVANYATYLQCLSSLEFETLIAKYLEEAGLFVPAYKGGFVRNFDLFCRNTGSNDIHIGQMVVMPKKVLSIQIKLNLSKKIIEDHVDLYFCINSDMQSPKIYDWCYLEKNIVKNSNTNKWLETTLDWVQLKT